MDIKCWVCSPENAVMQAKGGLLYSPPITTDLPSHLEDGLDDVYKYHLCRRHYNKVLAYMREMKAKKI